MDQLEYCVLQKEIGSADGVDEVMWRGYWWETGWPVAFGRVPKWVQPIRLSNWFPNAPPNWSYLCDQEEETMHHILFHCSVCFVVRHL